MNRFAFVIALLCASLLFMRGGGAHLHLCFDGQEPARSVHLADSGDFAEHGDDSTHQDFNLDLNDHGISKLPKLDGGLLALIFAFALALLLPRGQVLVPGGFAPLFFQSQSRLRPPLRGPPR